MGRFLADGRGRASICQRGQGPKESASHRMVKFSRGNSQGPGGYRDFNPCVSHHAPPPRGPPAEKRTMQQGIEYDLVPVRPAPNQSKRLEPVPV